jgi:tryptophan halogenase
MNKKIVVVGSGTAGALAATYLKKYYANFDVLHIREKNENKIGVGESTTPLLLSYFEMAGISVKDFLKETNATIKIGIRFENWMLENDTYWHNFKEIPTSAIPEYIENAGLLNLTDYLENNFKSGGATYSGKLDILQKVPFIVDNGKLIPQGNYALHVDAHEFSEYVLSKVKVNTVHASVKNVVIDKENIKHIVLDDDTVVEGDLFIDCTGFSKVLSKELPFEWESFSDWLCVNSAVAGRVYTDEIKAPVTIATAQDFGWIWHIPLKDRYGIGYVFDNEFSNYDEIESNLKKYCNERLDGELIEISHIKFEPGCLKKNWIGNCVAIGLSSGFVEPLEATNIHTIIYQVSRLARHYDGTNNVYTQSVYNKKVYDLQKNIKEVIKLHYLNRKDNNNFWKKANSVDEDLINKINGLGRSFTNLEFIEYNNNQLSGSDVFLSDAYASILFGLKYFDKASVKNFTEVHNLPLDDSKKVLSMKSTMLDKYITHKELLEGVNNSDN